MSSIANQERLMQVLLGPQPTTSRRRAAPAAPASIVLRVRTDATKVEIRKAVEMLFEVDVQSVSVLRVRGKSKRFGVMRGRRQDWKKAYIRLAPGQDLDFLGTE